MHWFANVSLACVATALAATIVPPASAQSTRHAIVGSVRDAEEGRLRGATVELVSRASGSVLRTTTGDDGAFRFGDVTAYRAGRARLESATRPVLVLFGTGWGLPQSLIEAADVRLEPIHARADTGYNHLSVRAACAITLDRLTS